MKNEQLVMLKRSGLVLAALVLLVGGGLLVNTLRVQAAAARYQRLMHDPAYLRAQTDKFQAQVEGKLHESYPHAQLKQLPHDGNDGKVLYAVELPTTEARDLPRLHAHLARLYAEYHRQGYNANFLINMDGKVVRSVP